MADIAGTSIEQRADQRGRLRHFFVYQSWFFVLVAFVGFGPNFYDYFAGTFPLPWTAHVHGAVMMAWLFAYAAQTSFAANGNLMVHRAWGARLVWLAGAVFVVMAMATVTSIARFNPSLTEMTFLYDVFAIQIVMMVWFAVFVTWGVLARGNSGWHRRMMTFATIVLLQAAVDRMYWLPESGLPMFWHQAIRLYALMAPMLAFDIITRRRLHPATLAASTLIVGGHALVSAVWEDANWRAFVDQLTRAWR